MEDIMLTDSNDTTLIRYNAVNPAHLINPTLTHEGFYRFKNVKVARVGLFDYSVRELLQDGIKNKYPDYPLTKIVRIHRDSDAFSDAVIDSFAGKPFTNDHPQSGSSQLINPGNANSFGAGSVGSKPYFDGEWLYADMITIYTEEAMKAAMNGKFELSIGYVYEPTQFVDGHEYVAKEKIKYINHVALVNRGRAGPECRLNEEGDDMAANELLNDIVDKLSQVLDESKSMNIRLNTLETSATINSKTNSMESEGNVSTATDSGNTETPIGTQKADETTQDGKNTEESIARANAESSGKPSVAGSEHTGSVITDTDGKQNGNERGNEMSTETPAPITPVTPAALSAEDLARQNDIFLSELDVQAMLNAIPYDNLSGFANGKKFSGRDHTRVLNMVNAEMVSRKNNMAASVPFTTEAARNNAAPVEKTALEKLYASIII